MKNFARYRGFTLLEMSMVIVIVGLILGGIVVTKEVIRNAQLQQIAVEYDHYVKAIKEFQDKYNALPGDFTGATYIWGGDSGCPSSPNNTPKTVTCNGNGDGRIGTVTELALTTNLSFEESFHGWQQLANAGLIEGKYSGFPDSAYQLTGGINVPASRLPGAAWQMVYFSVMATKSWVWQDQYGHILFFGAQPPWSNNSPTQDTNGMLTPVEAYQIDSKLDDGKPGRGTVRTWRSGGPYGNANCTWNDTSQDAQTYKVNYTRGLACPLMFVPGF